MTVHEPFTLLTDCLLGALAGWLGWRLAHGANASLAATRWWSRTLGLTAISAFVGGGYHGFGTEFPAIAATWWISVLLIICVLSAALAISLVCELVPAEKRRPWFALIAVKFAGFAAYAIVHPVFAVVIADYGLTLIAWTIAALWVRRAWSGWMLTGIALSVVAAVAQQMRWGLSAQFNHNDLYHVVQAMALFGFHRAANKLAGPR